MRRELFGDLYPAHSCLDYLSWIRIIMKTMRYIFVLAVCIVELYRLYLTVINVVILSCFQGFILALYLIRLRKPASCVVLLMFFCMMQVFTVVLLLCACISVRRAYLIGRCLGRPLWQEWKPWGLSVSWRTVSLCRSSLWRRLVDSDTSAAAWLSSRDWCLYNLEVSF